MSSSTDYFNFMQQLEAIQHRLVVLQERLEVEGECHSEFRAELSNELKILLQMFQSIQALSSQLSKPEQLQNLQRSLQEKELLLREVHHRIRNNFQIVLSLLDIQALQSGDTQTQTLLRDNQNRIRSIALVHEKLSRSEFVTINLGEYVQELTETLVRSYAIRLGQVTLRTEIDANITVSPERIMPIGLILNELITNALKHGVGNESGEIEVTLTMTPEGQAILAVSNTGRSFPHPSELMPNSFGLHLITNLLQQIDGTLSYPDSGVPSGNSNRIQISFDVWN